MTRCGLLANSNILDTSDTLANRFEPVQRWGMSPFTGDPTNAIWNSVKIGQFMQAGQQFSNVQAAFRLAFELPKVARIAVGADQPEHLREISAAKSLRVDGRQLERYRELLRQHAANSAVAR